MAGEQDSPVPRWPRRVPRALIRRLYETDAKGIRDERLIDDVGYALLDRCEAVRRVTHRLCPKCGGALRGAFKDHEGGEREISCEACGWASTWRRYQRSYKGRRIHGGRAFPAFMSYLAQFPKARTPRDRMLCIDRLIHAVHQDDSGVWVLPGAINLIEGDAASIFAMLDELAGLDGARPELAQMTRDLERKLVESEARTRQRHRESGKPDYDRRYFILPLDETEADGERNGRHDR